MQRKIRVESVNLNAKCWVVRPGTRYKFAKEFISESFVAIGHLDGYLFGERREFLLLKIFKQLMKLLTPQGLQEM